MRPTHTDLLDVLERFMLHCPDGRGDITRITVGPLSARLTSIPMPVTNLVGLTRPTQHLSERHLLEVAELYAARSAPFGWLVGTNSPTGLGERLEKSGFAVFEEFAGLALTDLEALTPPAGGTIVREIGSSERETYANTFGAAFGLPREVVDFLCDCYFFATNSPRTRNYLAFVPGESAPVAAGSSVYDETTSTVVLSGAAVVPAYRRRGVYRSLLHKRVADAHVDGIKAAVIQAVRNTSAPICNALGFREICAQTLYARF